MLRPTREYDEASFDLTPMIDVVLLLIIFFMMTAQFAASEGANVNLPEQPGHMGEQSTGASMVVDIDRTGQFSLWGSPISNDGLINAAILANPAGSKSQTRVLLRADKDCPATVLQNIAAQLSQVGIRAVSLATQSDGSDASSGPTGASPLPSPGGGGT